jgi:hypothetical protein
MATQWSTKILGKDGAGFGELFKDEYAVILMQGKNVFGDIIYCYVKVGLAELKRLQAELGTNNGQFNPSDYGTIIASGKGDPPEEVRAEIAVTYKMLDQPKPVKPVLASSAHIPQEKKGWDEY